MIMIMIIMIIVITITIIIISTRWSRTMQDTLSSRKTLTGECFDLVWNMTSCQERIYWIRISIKVFPSLGKPGRLQKVAWRRSHVEKDHDQVRRWYLPGNWCQQVFCNNFYFEVAIATLLQHPLIGTGTSTGPRLEPLAIAAPRHTMALNPSRRWRPY